MAPGAESRTLGLRWRFVRVQYSSHNTDSFRARYWSDPWAIDGPAAEQNLSRRVKSVTAIEVEDPIVIKLEDPELWNNPWIYFVEPGTLRLTEPEVPILREFLLRGGTAVLDDFHGPIEWENVEQEFKRVFPDREIVELPIDHPVFHCFYQLGRLSADPGARLVHAGPHVGEEGLPVAPARRRSTTAAGPMVLINWNTDMGDGVEWSNAEEYPGYIAYTAEAYRMMINEIVYSLTH